jgi:hypothetical protein
MSAWLPSSTPPQTTRGRVSEGKAPSPRSEISNAGALAATRDSVAATSARCVISMGPRNFSVMWRFSGTIHATFLLIPRRRATLLAQAAPDVVAEENGDEGSDRLYRGVWSSWRKFWSLARRVGSLSLAIAARRSVMAPKRSPSSSRLTARVTSGPRVEILRRHGRYGLRRRADAGGGVLAGAGTTFAEEARRRTTASVIRSILPAASCSSRAA